MERRVRRRHLAGREDMVFFLCCGLLAASFLAGIFFGHVLARRNPASVDTELERYILDYCTLGADGESGGRVFFSALAVYFRYPLPAFFLGFAAPGVLLIPVLSAACGFFLSFSICCFTGAFGKAGVPVAAAVFGLRCLIALPGFFILAVPALRNAVISVWNLISWRGRRVLRAPPDRSRWLRFCLVAAILLLGALLEVFVSPVLLRLVLEHYLR